LCPSWSSVALRYDVAFNWSINPFFHIPQVADASVREHENTDAAQRASAAFFNINAAE
jgi:hypothetical protein